MNAAPETQAAASAMPDPIVFTDSAAAKVADFIAEEGNPDLKLRYRSSLIAESTQPANQERHTHRQTSHLGRGTDFSTTLLALSPIQTTEGMKSPTEPRSSSLKQ